ncbi:CBS domain-containing protein [Sulfuracidifex metallicus]|uniref:CBS domain-containing protein n=1 Tax=Sulfuracidifex metallicus DSM 6482 = JCM 9184 TaxID=523847 RepID=A0A6A9QP96_SULME|nr:CBS domain-containing protein [Sulfuracidifex metallicus]MUN29011.1 CBS domain-containing protein [Sulfuracidifex metallicus DSM 6482 = JCM 9184]WOE50479.1 CBS domain-containing protein [Sulfuracidifex metallicus DSM 6482 = JCM 9184]
MMQEKIKKLIAKPVVTVTRKMTVLDTVKLMASQGIGSALVVDDDGKPVGIFTERDLLMSVARGDSLNTAVEKICTMGNLITVGEDDPIGKAAELMHEHNIRHLIVTNKEGKPVGVISIRDIINEKHLLSAISSKPDDEWVGGD